MKCPKCKEPKTKVIRTAAKTNKRRRMCLKCGYRFTTLEEVAEKEITDDTTR